MQFAGQRTTLGLEPIGDPVNVLIQITPEVLPDPGAILVTGITPQATILDGITEAAFLQLFHEQVASPSTIFVGYNTVRFDDEFMRYLHYRNFYDPYEWQWRDSRSRWDLLDVVRMTRALRPEGINWPFAPNGAPTNRLELITSLNGLDHKNAHDALSDVSATIAVAKLIQTKQPKLFQFLLGMRDKRKVAQLVQGGEPFVYSSGRYASEFEKTTAAIMLGNHPKKQGVLVYDLRHDPKEFVDMSPQQLVERWRFDPDRTEKPLPVKTLQFNRCPAVAPMSVLDADSQARLAIDPKIVQTHQQILTQTPDFLDRLYEALAQLDRKQQTQMLTSEQAVDAQLYDGFFDDFDRNAMRVVRAADVIELHKLDLNFHDQRLHALLPLYKARNFPNAMTGEERSEWEAFCHHRLLDGGQKSRLAQYFNRLQTLASQAGITQNQQYLLEELRLYGETIMPVDAE